MSRKGIEERHKSERYKDALARLVQNKRSGPVFGYLYYYFISKKNEVVTSTDILKNMLIINIDIVNKILNDFHTLELLTKIKKKGHGNKIYYYCQYQECWEEAKKYFDTYQNYKKEMMKYEDG